MPAVIHLYFQPSALLPEPKPNVLMSRISHWRVALAACLAIVATSAAHASVVLAGTRVIYPETEREVTLRLTNEGTAPALVQAWIDDGDANAAPDDTHAPFTLAPPLFRLDPRKGQALRIIYLQQPLPTDRESLFWLNVLEVPPMAADGAAQRNELQFAFRTRIKLMFRPRGLPGSADAAPASVRWRLLRKADGQQVLSATNPTPYHVTFTVVEAGVGSAVHRNDAGAMAAPGATVEFPLGDAVRGSVDAGEVRHVTINDFGAAVEGVSRIAAAPTD